MGATPADLPGQRLGRYQILRPVGRGGMAEVFLARSIGPGGIEKRVCVKRVLPGLAVDPRAAGRFATEARTALALQHANIVPVFDFGRDGQDLFLLRGVSELKLGESARGAGPPAISTNSTGAAPTARAACSKPRRPGPSSGAVPAPA